MFRTNGPAAALGFLVLASLQTQFGAANQGFLVFFRYASRHAAASRELRQVGAARGCAPLGRAAAGRSGRCRVGFSLASFKVVHAAKQPMSRDADVAAVAREECVKSVEKGAWREKRREGCL